MQLQGTGGWGHRTALLLPKYHHTIEFVGLFLLYWYQNALHTAKLIMKASSTQEFTIGQHHCLDSLPSCPLPTQLSLRLFIAIFDGGGYGGCGGGNNSSFIRGGCLQNLVKATNNASCSSVILAGLNIQTLDHTVGL